MKLQFFSKLLVLGALFVAATPGLALADVPFSCEPTQVIERSNRIGVTCSNSVVAGSDTISFVSYAKTDVALMERFVRVAISALLSKKKLFVEVPEDGSGNLNGCQVSNCRTVTFPFAVRD